MPRSGNTLLTGLEAADAARLAPLAQPVSLPRGTTVLDAGGAIDAVWFPETAVLSLSADDAGRGAIEVGVVGFEGMAGWPLLLGGMASPHRIAAQVQDGRALRIAAAPMLAACRASASLHAALLRFVDAMMAQMASTIASHGGDANDRRIARWLLMRHDRARGDQLLVRHDEIADALAIRRASVTDQLHVLEGERLVLCRRGRIVVRDRSALEAYAGAGYGRAETAYRALIAPFGKGAAAVA